MVLVAKRTLTGTGGYSLLAEATEDCQPIPSDGVERFADFH